MWEGVQVFQKFRPNIILFYFLQTLDFILCTIVQFRPNMGFGVGFDLTRKDSRCLRRSGHLLGHLGDLGLKYFSVSSNRVYLSIEFGERII